MANIVNDKVVITIDAFLGTKDKTLTVRDVRDILQASHSTAYNILTQLNRFNIVERIKKGKSHAYELLNSPQTKALARLINERKRISKNVDKSPINDRDIVVILYNNRKMIVGPVEHTGSEENKGISEETFVENISKKPEVIPKMIVLSNFDKFYNLIWQTK